MSLDKTITHFLQEQLSKHSYKASFVPMELIASALQTVEKNGIPSKKDEEYRYCPIDVILKKEFKELSKPTETLSSELFKKSFSFSSSFQIVMVNGCYMASLSKIPTESKVNIYPINEVPTALTDTFVKYFGTVPVTPDTLSAINTAYSGKGIFIHVPVNCVCNEPIDVIHMSTADTNSSFANIRSLFVAESNSQVSIREFFVSAHNSQKIFTNYLSEIVLDKNAQFTHYSIQNENSEAHRVNATQVKQDADSTFTDYTLSFGGALIRNNLNIISAGSNSESNLYGLAIVDKKQLVDNHTLIDHTVPNCNSNETYKGIVYDQGTCVFNGKIFVKPHAQKTNAYQSSKNILMSDEATVNTKPQLEIFANDVKCSHGTSTGKLDETALFYLKSRGIGEISAKNMLLQAFASEVTESIADINLKTYVEDLFIAKIQY